MAVPLLPAPLRRVLEDLERLPAIGPKSAQRIAFYLMEQSAEYLSEFGQKISALSEGINKCHICGMLADNDTCQVCNDPNRNKSSLCIVESSLDVIAIERTGEYNGLFHVLGGLLSPLDNVGPDDLNISKIISRMDSEKPSEIILALNPSTEGETTALYLRKLILSLETEITVSKIAQGLPTGAALEFADDLTISRALSGRQKISG